MKVLIVSGGFFPINSPRANRTTELAKEFSRQGHSVTIYFPETKYNYTSFSIKHPRISLKPIAGLTWRKTKRMPHKFNRLMQMLFEFPSIQWYFLLPNLLKQEREYDLLISIAVPHPIHWGIAHCYKKGIKVAKKWIADCGDPYMGCKTESYKKPFYFAWFEKLFCKHADFITIPTKESIDGYYPEFHHKIKVVPQGFNFDDVKIDVYKPNIPIQFCYAGGFIPGIRDPRPILDALAETDINFIFHVYTNTPDLLYKHKYRLGEKLIINPYIPRLELIKFMSKMDFLLNIENGTSVQTPSKLIDYSLTKRPILSLDSQSLEREKLNAFLNKDYSLQLVIKEIGTYNIENVTKAFLSLTEL